MEAVVGIFVHYGRKQTQAFEICSSRSITIVLKINCWKIAAKRVLAEVLCSSIVSHRRLTENQWAWEQKTLHWVVSSALLSSSALACFDSW